MFFKKEIIVKKWERITPQPKWIRARRIELKIGVRELAELVGVSPSSIVQIEDGTMKAVSRELAIKINRILKNGESSKRIRKASYKGRKVNR